MTEKTSLNWLQRTNEIPAIWESLAERFGADRIDAICTGKWHELGLAVMANALGLAIDTTGLSTRKKRRMGPAMLDIMFKALPLIFMFGYMARMEEERKSDGRDNGADVRDNGGAGTIG